MKPDHTLVKPADPELATAGWLLSHHSRRRGHGELVAALSKQLPGSSHHLITFPRQPRVGQCSLRRDPLLWVDGEQLLDQIDGLSRDILPVGLWETVATLADLVMKGVRFDLVGEWGVTTQPNVERTSTGLSHT